MVSNQGNATFYTYIHLTPELMPFYVGKGTWNRCFEFYKSKRNLHHCNIVAKYGRENIVVIPLKQQSQDLAFFVEKWLIRLFRNAGVILANYTDGGEGNQGRTQSQATREKISVFQKGRVKSLEERRNISIAARRSQSSGGNTAGYKQTEATKMKTSLSQKARWARIKANQASQVA